MAFARSSHTLTVLKDGRVLAVGGFGKEGGIGQASVEIYDPSLDSWSPAASMTIVRIAHTATMLRDGRVLVAGGFGSLGEGGFLALESAEVYDPSSDTWSPSSTADSR